MFADQKRKFYKKNCAPYLLGKIVHLLAVCLTQKITLLSFFYFFVLFEKMNVTFENVNIQSSNRSHAYSLCPVCALVAEHLML